MLPRFHCPLPLRSGDVVELPAAVLRHVQVLRMQPGQRLTLFQGQRDAQQGLVGGEFCARLLDMQRHRAHVRIEAHHALEREAARRIHILAAHIARERFDWMLEKATELGAASITVLHTERCAQRIQSAHVDKKRAHWQAQITSACEQCGRNQLPALHGPLELTRWLDANPPAAPAAAPRWLLSLAADARPLAAANPAADQETWLLCGPEGGWSAAEEALCRAHGFTPTSLGPCILRAETTPLVALALLTHM